MDDDVVSGTGRPRERLRAHLQTRYGITVDAMTELDLGVWRVSRADGPDWVARWFSARRSDGAVAGDAAILRYLAARAFPAERCAADGLPEGLIHPDFVLANVVATPDGMVLVDWAGAGRGPRLWPLAFLLYAEATKDPRRAGAVLLGYREHVALEAEELDRLAAVARARPLVLSAWAVCMGRTSPTQAMTAASQTRTLTELIATRVRASATGR
jgi:hypothetical protein